MSRDLIKAVRRLLVLLALATSVPASSNDEQWTRKTLEAFDGLCYRTAARFSLIEKMAAVHRFRPVPDEDVPAILGPDNTTGKAYVVDWDKDRGIYVFLVIAKPDTCSVMAKGFSYRSISDVFRRQFKLVLAFRDDVGMQVSELFVPGGRAGTKQEAIELGLAAATYPKPEYHDDLFTLSYIPPGTAKDRFGSR